MLNIILFGPPGAGKGTQSQFLIEKYQLIHISTGDLLRSEMAAGTELGLKAKSFMDQGVLVPDAVVIGMIDAKLKENRNAKGFIFDGFPRTIPQAQALDELLANNKQPIRGLLALEVSEPELISRILERGKTSGRADDQNEELVQKRVTEYNTKTKAVADYYAQKGLCHQIDGIGEIEDIRSKLFSVMNSI